MAAPKAMVPKRKFGTQTSASSSGGPPAEELKALATTAQKPTTEVISRSRERLASFSNHKLT